MFIKKTKTSRKRNFLSAIRNAYEVTKINIFSVML